METQTNINWLDSVFDSWFKAFFPDGVNDGNFDEFFKEFAYLNSRNPNKHQKEIYEIALSDSRFKRKVYNELTKEENNNQCKTS